MESHHVRSFKPTFEASFLRGLERAEAQVAAPQRILFIQRPVGTVPQNWFPAGRGATFELSRILQQFAALRDRMVVFEDIRFPSDGSVGGGHERGTVLMLTGQRTTRLYPGNGGDDPMAEGPSFDQYLANGAPGLQGTAIASLQLAADSRADTPEVSTRITPSRCRTSADGATDGERPSSDRWGSAQGAADAATRAAPIESAR